MEIALLIEQEETKPKYLRNKKTKIKNKSLSIKWKDSCFLYKKVMLYKANRPASATA